MDRIDHADRDRRRDIQYRLIVDEELPMCRMQAGLLPVSFGVAVSRANVYTHTPVQMRMCTACGSQSSKIKRFVRSSVRSFHASIEHFIWRQRQRGFLPFIHSAAHSLTRVWTPTICDAVSLPAFKYIRIARMRQIAILATRVCRFHSTFFKRFVEFSICFCRSFQLLLP